MKNSISGNKITYDIIEAYDEQVKNKNTFIWKGVE